MDTDGRLSRRGERQMAPFVFTGVSIAHPRMFDGAPQGPLLAQQTVGCGIETGTTVRPPLDGLWMHVGTPEAIEEAERRIESEKSLDRFAFAHQCGGRASLRFRRAGPF